MVRCRLRMDAFAQVAMEHILSDLRGTRNASHVPEPVMPLIISHQSAGMSGGNGGIFLPISSNQSGCISGGNGSILLLCSTAGCTAGTRSYFSP